MLTRAGLRGFATTALKVFDNVAKQQFMTTFHGAEATLDYKVSGDTISFLYTNVPPEFQGKGVGKLLAEYAFDHAQQMQYTVIVKCHFLAGYYEKNLTKYKDLQVKINLDE